MASVTDTTKRSDQTSSKDVSINDLAKQLDVLKADISGLTSTVADYTKAKSVEASTTAKAKANEAVEAGREKALIAQMQAEDFVKTQPVVALGLAAGVGIIVGLLAARR